MNRSSHPLKPKQRGTVLLIGMVMLLMITMIAVGLIRLSTRHTQVVNNEQVRTESVAASNYALDIVLNQPQTQWSGYDGAGKVEYVNLGTVQSDDATTVSVPVRVSNLAMKRCRRIMLSELITVVGGVNQVASENKGCIVQSSPDQATIVDTGSPGTPNGKSYCAASLFEVQATSDSTDAKVLQASATSVQGVEVRTTADKIPSGVACE
jgi:Tfp pilus assembly protein PilX